MTCCPPGEFAHNPGDSANVPSADDVVLTSKDLGNGIWQTSLAVPNVHCGACIQRVEAALGNVPGIRLPRVNLSTRRLNFQWSDKAALPRVFATLAASGYPATLIEPTAIGGADTEYRDALKALAVAAFAAMNVMMLSVPVWAGAEGVSRDFLHWVSGFIALPALLYSGRIFYLSAWQSLRHGHTNMDVPITIGVALAFALSVYETTTGAEHAYFDAVTALLFFLLAGRTLDHLMRDKARTAVKGLVRMAPRGAIVIGPNNRRDYVPLADVQVGDTISVAPGERIPVDAEVISGSSEIDQSIINGESLPTSVSGGELLHAGGLNLTGSLLLKVMAPASGSLLAEMVRLMEVAEAGRGRYRRIADRAARIYAPVVHLAAALTFVGWFIQTGDVHMATVTAVSVLIITCPCALGLAVPMVHVVAAGRLFRAGVMVKDSSALERLSEINAVAFDKTGTLTLGAPILANAAEIDNQTLATAAALAVGSRHPHAQAIAAAGASIARPIELKGDTRELPGLGIELVEHGETLRLGRAAWAEYPEATHTGTVFSRNGEVLAVFELADALRPGAKLAIENFVTRGLSVEILSGDRLEAVENVASQLHVEQFSSGLMPQEKVNHLNERAAKGQITLMVGDGINDAPALAAAHVSMAPSSASDIGRSAADLVFMHGNLDVVPMAYDIAHRAAHLVRQNFGLAILYNLIAIPIAVLGHVTPLTAALAMSASSIAVVTNSLRVEGKGWVRRLAVPVTASRHLPTKEMG